MEGQIMRLSDFRGSIVVVDFWADWCPWCHDIYSFGGALKYQFKNRPFVLVGVNSDEDQELASRVITDKRITWPNWWLGKNRQIGRDYPVQRYPTTLVLDRDGVNRFRSFGPVDDRSLSRAASTLLDEREDDQAPVHKSREAPATGKSAVRKKNRSKS
jgi:thiol-disulfide isomerase/thioredoxin